MAMLLVVQLACASLLIGSSFSSLALAFEPLKDCRLQTEEKAAQQEAQGSSQPSASSSPYVPLPASFPSSSSSPHVPLPVASIVLGALSCIVVACILLLAAVSFFVRRWHTQKQQFPSLNLFSPAEGSIPPIRRFTLNELQSFTCNFCHQLGRKPNSTNFKGWINGIPVAVKKVEAKGGGQDGFLASVYQASCVNHSNLVKLLGFCLEGAEMLLVYEYLEAGSLDMVLLKAAEALDWDARYGIAMKVAQALLFLHEECGECLAHGNVKLENIMLGEDLCPKLADFGLADLCVRERIIAWKNARDGGSANISPTWLSSFKASASTDVYGFGLVLLSLVLGRGNIVDALAASNDPIFLEWIYLQAKQGMYEDALDGRLLLEANPKEVRVSLQLAFCCMQDDSTARPTMKKAWQALKDREEMGLPLLTSLAFGCHVSTESDGNSDDPNDHVLVVDVEKDKEDGAASGHKEEIEPCYQVFGVRSQRRSMSSVSSA